MSDYNIKNYSIQELLDVFNIDIPNKNNIINKINIYSTKIQSKKEKEFIQKAKDKLLHWINTESNQVIKTKEVSDMKDPTLLNPIYKNILTRTINIDSTFRSNTLPKTNESILTYNSKNLKLSQKKESCEVMNSSTNFIAQLSDKLNNVVSIQLINYTIPYTWYNIDMPYYNNYFTYYTSITDTSGRTVTLESGNYTLDKENNIYDSINNIISQLSPSSENIIFTYNKKSSKTTIKIYKKYFGKNDFYYRFKWFNTLILNSKSDSTLGYKLGFRHFELLITGDIDTDINNQPIIYLKLTSKSYTPLITNFFLKQTIKNNNKNLPYNIYNQSIIYFTKNDIDLYMNDVSNLVISYKKEPIYYLEYDQSFNDIYTYFTSLNHNSTLIQLLSPLSTTSWKAFSGPHLTPQNIIREYSDVSLNIEPYIYGTYTSDAVANLRLTKYLLLGIDDYQNNRINTGLISIEPIESYININKINNTQLKVSNCIYSNDINYYKQYTNKIKNELQTTTTTELKTINALEQNKAQTNYKSRSPTINIFAIIKIPLDNTLVWGQLISNDNIFNNQYIRNYFGPVTLNSFKVTLYTENGYLLKLNDNNWNFSLFCKQLYKY